MLNLFRRKQKDLIFEQKCRYFSDILVNDSNGESKLAVQDYTSNPNDFLIDLPNFPYRLLSNDSPIIKVRGIVAGLKTKAFCTGENSSEYSSLSYEGILLVNSNFPLYFSAFRHKDEIPNLGLEELLLESAKKKSITVTGRLIKMDNPGYPFVLKPYVIQLGEYISPRPKKKLKELLLQF